jgi:hypothetical protein
MLRRPSSHVAHPDALLTPEGRRTLVDFGIDDGWAEARGAERSQVWLISLS